MKIMDKNKNNKEDLRELFERFLGPDKAEQAIEDFREGERIIRQYPVAKPDGEVVADIKAKVTRVVLGQKANIGRRMAYRATAAAAIVLLAGIFVSVFEKYNGRPERAVTASIIPTEIWESEDISTDDAELATLTAEIEQIESEISAVRLDATNGNGGNELTELEMEFTEINSEFWKG